jgi:hypothetical protein
MEFDVFLTEIRNYLFSYSKLKELRVRQHFNLFVNFFDLVL